jgi:UDP-2,3-diacylglucosamine pyrophosphatase LpxH
LKLLIVSDMHLGRGRFLSNGKLNVLEDFDEDERFAELLEHYSSGTYYFSEINLILNGDILNLIQLDVDGIHTHLLREEDIVSQLDGIIKGHPVFFEALRKFAAKPQKTITYVIGNHDIGMVSEKAQAKFNEAVGCKVEFTMAYFNHGVWIEHGHRFESINNVPQSKIFVPGPGGTPILNLPWGALFCLYLMPELKKDRPYFDKVRPMSLYLRWSLINDTSFFMKLFFMVIKYMFVTQFKRYTQYNKNFRVRWTQIFQFSVYPWYVSKAKRVFSTRPDVKVVIMGHTHITEWRRFKGDKFYLNTGTWNNVPSVDAGMHRTISHLTYVKVECDPETKKVLNTYINSWQGKWKPYREEASTAIRY